MDDYFESNSKKTVSKPKDNVFFSEHAAKPEEKKKSNLFSISDSDSEDEEEFTTRKLKINKKVPNEKKEVKVESVQNDQLEDYEKEEYRQAMEKVKRDVAERRRLEEEEKTAKMEKQKKEEERKKKIQQDEKKLIEEREKEQEFKRRQEEERIEREEAEKLEKERLEMENKNKLFQVKPVFKPEFEDLNDILKDVSLSEKKKAPPLPSRNKSTVTTSPQVTQSPLNTVKTSTPTSTKKVDVNSLDFDLDKYINTAPAPKKKGLFD